MKTALYELEMGFWQAACDIEYYRQHAAAEALFILPFGKGCFNLKECMDFIEMNKESWQVVQFDDFQVKPIAPDMALVVYGADASKASGKYKTCASSIYEKKSRWQLIFHQQTPLKA